MTPPDPRAPAWLAIDWGTSTLRLWAMLRDGTPVAAHTLPRGMSEVPRGEFREALDDAIRDLSPAVPDALPAIACGMVGARQGWLEAPYVAIPAGLADIAGAALAVPDAGRDLRILPGLASRDPVRPDVMRGEETQLLGLLLDEPDYAGVVVLPGTHSKWVRIEAGRVVRFATVMTGELFGLLSRHSILRHSLADAAAPAPDAAAFRRGVAEGLARREGLGASLFGIRAADLLLGERGNAASARLSGLLIGAEIGGAAPASVGLAPGETVTLVADDRFAPLYRAALLSAGHEVAVRAAETLVRAGLLAAALAIWPAQGGRLAS